MNRSFRTHLTLAAAAAGALYGFGPRFHLNTPTEGGGGTGTPPPNQPPKDPIAGLRQEFSKLKSEAEQVLNTAMAANRELTAEEKKANEGRFARMSAIKGILEEHSRFATMAIADPAGTPGSVHLPRDPEGRDEFKQTEGADPKGKFDRAEFSKALTRWAMTGAMAGKFATITTATASGAMLPREIAQPLVPTTANVIREAMALYGVQPVTTETTADLTIPVLGVNAGQEVAQDASAETENGMSLSGSIVLNVKTYESKSAWFSNQQLAATDFDLVSYIQTDLMYAKEMGFEGAIIAAIIADAGITQVVNTATTSGFIYDNLVDLNNKLPKLYQRQKVMILSATAYSAAEKMVGEDGHPVLNQDTQNQNLKRFNGTPVLRSDYLEAFGVSKVVGLIVSMLGFRIRDVRRLDLARYMESGRPNQTGFNLFGYHGHGYTPSAVAKLKTPAS